MSRCGSCFRLLSVSALVWMVCWGWTRLLAVDCGSGLAVHTPTTRRTQPRLTVTPWHRDHTVTVLVSHSSAIWIAICIAPSSWSCTGPFSALTLLVQWQEWHPVCKKTGRWFVSGDDLTGAFGHLLAPVVTTVARTCLPPTTRCTCPQHPPALCQPLAGQMPCPPTGSVHLAGQGRPGYNRWKRITGASLDHTVVIGAGSLVVEVATALAGQAQQWVSEWLSPPPPSPLAPIKFRMETFWYQLTQVRLENGC